MVNAFDRIVIAVPDLAGAVGQYERLLGAAPLAPPGPTAVPTAWLGLPNTVLEMQQRPEPIPSIAGVVFTASAGDHLPPAARQLGLSLDTGEATRNFRLQHPEACSEGFSVDHLVLRTADADACVELFAATLGLRLALDRTVPEWGGRMLFFRAGKLTLEVIEPHGGGGGRDRFWGIAFQCADIGRAVGQMVARGVTLSPVRDGRKPGTRVATVKSSCLDIPTLLIEQAH